MIITFYSYSGIRLHASDFSWSLMTFLALSQFKLEILRNRMKNACLLVKTWSILPANVVTVCEASLLLMFEHISHIFYRFTVVSIQLFSIIFTQNVFVAHTQTKLEVIIKPFEQFFTALVRIETLDFVWKRPVTNSGAPNVNFWKISVRKTIWDTEFRNICCKISCLPTSPRIFEHLKNGIISPF